MNGLVYGDYGHFYVVKGCNRPLSRKMCATWERKGDGKLWPKGWEKGFHDEMDAWNYLTETRPEMFS